MITKSRIRKICSSLLLSGVVLAISGSVTGVLAQGPDPFRKPVVKSAPVRDGKGAPGLPGGTVKLPTGALGIPPVEQRVNYYMNVIRPQCIVQNCPQMPKPTVVMTIAEMQVTGITRTPRGYAAIVELTPIKLSYTIYPGEKFFDGQLVAVEDNGLVFRRVTKMSDGKFVVAEEKKVLRKMSFQEELARNTLDALPSAGATESEKIAQGKPVDLAANKDGEGQMSDPTKVVSPLDEMLKAEKAAPKDAKAKPADKTKPKVAKKKN